MRQGAMSVFATVFVLGCPSVHGPGARGYGATWHGTRGYCVVSGTLRPEADDCNTAVLSPEVSCEGGLPIPVTRETSPIDWESVAVGEAHACAVSAAGIAYCWGANDVGESGPSSEQGGCSLHRIGESGQVVAVGVRRGVSTLLDARGSLFGLGYTDGAIPGAPPAGHVSGGSYRFLPEVPGVTVALDAHGGSTCVISDDSVVSCWGTLMSDSQGGALESSVPMWQRLPGLSLRGVAIGGTAACVASADQVRCWQQSEALWRVPPGAAWQGGWQEDGGLRVGTVWRLDGGLIQDVCVLDDSVCVLLGSGEVRCLAVPDDEESVVVASGATAIACAGGTVCVGRDDGVLCGDVASGVAQEFSASGSRALSLSSQVLCNIDRSGGLQCWARRMAGTGSLL